MNTNAHLKFVIGMPLCILCWCCIHRMLIDCPHANCPFQPQVRQSCWRHGTPRCCRCWPSTSSQLAYRSVYTHILWSLSTTGAAELLAARGATLLSMLAEREQPSFLDSVAEHAASRSMARGIVARLGRNTGKCRHTDHFTLPQPCATLLWVSQRHFHHSVD